MVFGFFRGRRKQRFKMKKTILSFGEMLWDILPTETILGGAPCNFAYRVNSIGDRGIIVSRLGRDDLGKKAYECVSSLGLDTTYLQWDDNHSTGTVQVTFKDNNPDFVIVPNVAYDYIEMTDSLREVASITDCLCFGTVSQRSLQNRQTLKQLLELAGNSLKLLDINLRKDCYTLDTVIYSLEKADILKLNEDELYQLADMLDIANRNALQLCEYMIKKWSIKYCVVTLGEKGAFALSDKNEKVYVPGYKINLVDSVGAGDAFTAGFAYCILRDLSLVEACRFGNVLGALVATKKGATSPITQDEIELLFKCEGAERVYDRSFEQY
jgi:fructokinase